TITGFAPNHGPIGTRITIYGHNLTGAQVQFNGVTAENVTVDPTGTHVKATVPGEVGDGPGQITVMTAQGAATSSAMFTVGPSNRPPALPHPRISSFAPTSGKAGAKVTIRGANLGGALWVKFGGVKATFAVPTRTKIVATVP